MVDFAAPDPDVAVALPPCRYAIIVVDVAGVADLAGLRARLVEYGVIVPERPAADIGVIYAAGLPVVAASVLVGDDPDDPGAVAGCGAMDIAVTNDLTMAERAMLSLQLKLLRAAVRGDLPEAGDHVDADGPDDT